MDALFHFVFSMAGAYALVKGLRLAYGMPAIISLSAASLLADADHLTGDAGIGWVRTHTLLVVLVPLLPYLWMLLTKSLAGKREYLLVLSVLFLGHLSMDMIEGLYGVSLFYPFSGTQYLIPESWGIYLRGDPSEPIVGTHGIGAAIYFGAVALVISLRRFLSPEENGKRTSTRR